MVPHDRRVLGGSRPRWVLLPGARRADHLRVGRTEWATVWRVLAAGAVGLVLAAGIAACGRGSGVPPVPGRYCPTAFASPNKPRGPVFYVADPGGCSAHAYDYSGVRTGGVLAFPPCIEACRGPDIAPDGWVPSGTAVTGGLSSMIWASDSRRRCGFPQGRVRPVRVGWFDVDAPQQLHVTAFLDLFARLEVSRFGVVGCDIEGDRAVLTAESTSSAFEAVAVVSLSKPKVLFERHFDTPNDVTAISVAPNGLEMAVQHAYQPPARPYAPVSPSCSQTMRDGRPFTLCAAVSPQPASPPPVPTGAELYSLSSSIPALTGRVSRRALVGWSGDGSRIVTVSPDGPGDGVCVLRTSDGKIVWQTTETLNLAVSAPGIASIALQTYDASHHRSSITLLDELGHAEHLSATGTLMPSH